LKLDQNLLSFLIKIGIDSFFYATALEKCCLVFY